MIVTPIMMRFFFVPKTNQVVLFPKPQQTVTVGHVTKITSVTSDT